MKKSRTIKNTKNTTYQEIDNAIWLYNYVTGSKLRKMTTIPNELKGVYRDEFVNEMIEFYKNN